MRCPACLTVNPAANRFCGQCGTRMAPAAATAAAPKGEVKLATVLFADVVSSTERVAQLDAEQAMEQLRPAVMQMCADIERFGGTVLRTLGDGVMALFGVPRALEGHARLACEAALAMQAAFAGNQLGLSIRVGLHTGPVASDPADAAAQKGGGVHGVTIHIASRVVALAPPGGVCLTRDCLTLTGAGAEFSSLGPQVLKGIASPTEVFVLARLGGGANGEPFHRAALSRLRGRSVQLAVLQDALRLAEHGQTLAVGVSGAPGTGKSRLCHEFADWCRGRLVPVFQVRSQLYGHATPLQPVLELLRTYFFGISPTDGPAQARERIEERLQVLGPPRPADFVLLQEFLGVSAVDSPPSTLHPRARRARLLHIVRDLVARSSTHTSVIIFEDLHWLDEASAEFVSAMVDAVVGTRTLLVLNYRPGCRSPWAQVPHFREVELSDLSADDTTALVRELIGARTELLEAAPLIVQRSAGNPFFAEELVRALGEGGWLTPPPGAAPLSLEALAKALPPTVQAVIGARIDGMEGAQKALLQFCAVIGKEIPLPVLAQVASPLGDRIEPLLEALCAAELIQPQAASAARGARPGFTFRHPLIQEVAYGTQLKSSRAAVHARTALAMESFYRERGDEFAALIAYHHAQAGQSVPAAQFEARAARWIGSTDSAVAIQHWRKVRSLLQDQPHGSKTDGLRALAGGRIVYLGWREGLPLAEVQTITDEALGLASHADPRLVQMLLLARGRMLQGSGGPADAYADSLRQALALSARVRDPGRTAMLHVALSQAYAWSGLLDSGLAANDVAIRGVGKIDVFDRDFIGFSIEQWVLAIRLRLLNRMGRLADARRCLTQLLQVERSMADDPLIRQIEHFAHADWAFFTGDTTMAAEHAAHVRQIAAQHGNPYARVFAQMATGLAQQCAGDGAAAAGSFVEGLRLLRSGTAAVDFEAELLAGLVESRAMAGHDAGALQAVSEAFAVAERSSNRLARLRVLIAASPLVARRGDGASRARAKSYLDEAEVLMAHCGAWTYEGPLGAARAELQDL